MKASRRALFVLLCLTFAAACTGKQRPAASPAGATASATRTAAGYIIADPKFAPLPGARALYGRLGGATYQIEVPDNWNHELVLYAHGFTGNDPFLFVVQPPLRSYFVQQGFAWAASSFSGVGYVPDLGLQDTLALRDLFIAQVGQPARTYMDGTSMGGHVVVSAMEQHPELFAGALSECGVIGGVQEIDYLISYVALGSYLTNTPLFPVTDTRRFEQAVANRVVPALGSKDAPTPAGKQFEDVLGLLTGGPRPWRHEGFTERRSENFDLAAADDPGRPSIAFRAGTNVGVEYQINSGLGLDAAKLNAGVPRIPADPAIRNAATHPDFAPRTGHLQAPMLTLHTTGDAFVPISQERDYRRLVDAAGSGNLLVQRAIRRPGHCQFTDAELTRGFADLVNWVENGVVPAGDDLAGDLRDVGRQFTVPLLPGDPGGE